jgi:hypothetical protein
MLALPPRSANDSGGTPSGVQGAEPLAGGANLKPEASLRPAAP